MKISVINGPNLNMLGIREPLVYGSLKYSDLCNKLKEYENDNIKIDIFQSNHEGDIIDHIHKCVNNDYNAIVINPGGLTHYSVSLADALNCFNGIKIEVHISNIYKREDFRKIFFVSPVCNGVISGLGVRGYFLALEYILNK